MRKPRERKEVKQSHAGIQGYTETSRPQPISTPVGMAEVTTSRRNSISKSKEAGSCHVGTASGEPGGERLEGSGDLAVPRCLERRTGRRVSRGAQPPWAWLLEVATVEPRAPRPSWFTPTSTQCLLGARPGAGHRRNNSKESSHGPCLHGWST